MCSPEKSFSQKTSIICVFPCSPGDKDATKEDSHGNGDDLATRNWLDFYSGSTVDHHQGRPAGRSGYWCQDCNTAFETHSDLSR